MSTITPEMLNKIRGPFISAMMTDEEGHTIYELSPIDALNWDFYKDLPQNPHILVEGNGPWFHRLCMYWLKNTLKDKAPPEIAKLMPDWIPIYFTKLSFLMLPRY